MSGARGRQGASEANVKLTFVHESAIVEPGAEMGPGTRVWAFAHILGGAQIGADCNICDHVFIENDVVLGDRVTVKSGVQVWDGIRLEDDVFIGPNATFTNDPFPRSKQHLEEFTRTLVRRGASIGANATILAGTIVGAMAMIGAGAVVTRDVPPNAIVAGNPARIQGYVASQANRRLRAAESSPGARALTVLGVQLIHLPLLEDLRGSLTFAEYGKHLPFDPKRYFVMLGVPTSEVRGEHAHREQHRFLVCLRGTCSVVLDDGKCRDEVVLSQPNVGLHIPPMIWATHYKYSEDAVLLVLVSDVYDVDDYIRDYDLYLEMAAEQETTPHE